MIGPIIGGVLMVFFLAGLWADAKERERRRKRK